jgi:hypothetical protein
MNKYECPLFVELELCRFENNCDFWFNLRQIEKIFGLCQHGGFRDGT